MSIVKNDKVSYHTDITIRRLPKGEVTSFGTTSCVFKHYVQMNNRYFNTPWYLGAGESVFIKAEIEQNAEGYFYGHNRNASGSNNGHSIRKNGANIEWLNGNTVVVSKPWSAGVHLFGWVGTISADTNGCKPWYDGEIISDTLVRGGGRGEYARIGGLIEGTSTTTTDNKYCIHSTASWAIRVYEVTAYSFSSYSGVARYPRMYHMYAAASSDGTAVYMAEPRYSLTISSINDGGAVSGVTRSSSVVDFPDGVSGYGVQFADLREITGSNYTQLLAVLTDDDARKASENADVPYVINGRNFAFKINTVPSGATTSGGVGYADGDLIRGRRPKWDIWNDAIKFGFYVSGAPKKLKFNIFKDNCGDDITSSTHRTRYGSTDLLGVFEGYDTSKHHQPSIEVIDGNLKTHIHNGAFVKCSGLEVLAGAPRTVNGEETQQNNKDNESVFVLNTNVGGAIKYCPGNLIPWNYTRTQCEQWLGWLALGCKLKVNIAIGSTEEEYLTSEHTVGAPYLNADTASDIKNEYRSNGFTDSLEIVKNKWYILDHLIKDSSTGVESLPMKASLSMIGDTGDIDCSNLIDRKDVSLTAIRNSAIQSGSSAFRMIIDTTENIGIVGRINGWASLITYHVATNPQRSAIAFPIIGCEKSTTKQPENYAYSDGTSKTVYYWNPIYADKDYVCVMELYYTTSASGQTRYNAAVTVKNAIRGMQAFKTNYEWMIGEVWGDSNVPGTRNKALWHEMRNDIMNSGNNISNLSTYSRVIVADKSDFFGANNDTIPENSTAIAHIYDKSKAPIFGGLYGPYTWDGEHHVNVEHFTGRHIAFTKLFYSSDNLSKMDYICLAYDSSYNLSSFVPNSCNIEVYVNNVLLGTAYIDEYNYKPMDMNGEAYHIEQYYGLSGSTRKFTLTIRNNDAPDELIYGLNNVYWRGAYFGISIAFETPLNRGDFVTIRFTN